MIRILNYSTFNSLPAGNKDILAAWCGERITDIPQKRIMLPRSCLLSYSMVKHATHGAAAGSWPVFQAPIKPAV